MTSEDLCENYDYGTLSTSENTQRLSISPARGNLVPLRTRAEQQAHNETIDIYVCKIPVNEAARVLRAVKTIPNQNTVNLHHLRRIVRNDYLPESLKKKNVRDVQCPDEPCQSVRSGSKTQTESYGTRVKHNGDAETLHVFLCGVPTITKHNLLLHLHSALPALFPPSENENCEPCFASLEANPNTSPSISQDLSSSSRAPRVFVTPAPLNPPGSTQEASKQSATFWPTLYNPNTYYGPNPSAVTFAQDEISANAGFYMGLARHIAQDAQESGRGVACGVVVVERSNTSVIKERIVAVAGDARFEFLDRSQGAEISTSSTLANESEQTEKSPCRNHGNPACHAILRAIALVALKRRSLVSTSISTSAQDSPLTALESRVIANNISYVVVELHNGTAAAVTEPNNPTENIFTGLNPNGYLCLNLEFYTTHEPCIMCGMALVHSRVGKVVFARRMPLTGSLVVGPGKSEAVNESDEVGDGSADKRDAMSGYGLFWREELNWRFLAWEWKDDEAHAEDADALELDDVTHA